ncbi:hypothetical protein JHK85_019413 [Glycine max]|nr:hypothetical protein JHK85_019413 [Glycine max]
MKALRTLRRTLYSPTPATVFRAFFSAQPQPHHDDPTDSSVFDSSHYALEAEPTLKPEPKPTWDEKYRARADRVVFGEEGPKGKLRVKEEEDERRRRALAKALLEAAMDEGEDEEEEGKGAGLVKEDDQKSLSVGIIGAPNAGKSALTNYMVGTKVAAVSRKTNTTTHEVVGVLTKGDTQICFFDTPGLMLNCGGFPYRDVKVRVESAWSSVFHDIRTEGVWSKRSDSVLDGAGMHLSTSTAVQRPWEEDPFTMSEEVMKMIALEVVRERLLDHVHQEIPYDVEHRLIDWKELRDGSLRIEQHFITNKLSQCKILVGKNGSKIGGKLGTTGGSTDSTRMLN